MENQTKPISDQELFDAAKRLLDRCDKKIVSVLLNRKAIVDKLYGDWTDDEKSFIKAIYIYQQCFRSALGVCFLNADIDLEFYRAVITLLNEGVFCEKQLDEAYEFLYG